MLRERRQLDRAALIARYGTNRRRSSQLFSIVQDAMYEQPIELRHPFIFYLGHIPAFAYNTLARRALGKPSLNPDFDDLFRRGIDPESVDVARRLTAVWPSVDAVQEYATRIDTAIEAILRNEEICSDDNPLLVDAQAVFTILEHEEMHQETLMYIVTCLPDEKKNLADFAPVLDPSPVVKKRKVTVPGGAVTLGAYRGQIEFGWDNEFDAVAIHVEEFSLDSHPVTNGEYLRFVEAGASAPAQWVQTPSGWAQRTVIGSVPLQPEWPVYVSYDAAAAYARAYGGYVMSEAEYQRAAYTNPHVQAGNFDFTRFHPVPVGMTQPSNSTYGVAELVGNGWEWTSTPFAPLPGFEPMASYPEYSADFFDGKHNVLKGASPITAATLVRPSLRNWFRTDYPYAFSKFRVAYR